MDKKNILLSVIIPCKNEARNIERCLLSLVSELKSIGTNEILLVDSRSTDSSLEKARSFPIRIVQLKENWDISPAAARYIGCRYTSGKYRLFIDGDMELIPGFLAKAIEFLENDHQAAGVAGLGTEFYREGGKLENMYQRPESIAVVELLAGAALFKSEALEKVGYFNPFLRAEEEYELCRRLIKADYRLVSLPIAMINHHTSRSLDNFERRLKAGMFRGIGQMFRLTLEQGIFSLSYFTRFKLFIVFFLLLTALVSGLIGLLIFGNALIIQVWGAFSGALLLVYCLKKGFKPGLLSVYKSVIINTQILSGLFVKTPYSSNYPDDVIIIKERGYDQ